MVFLFPHKVNDFLSLLNQLWTFDCGFSNEFFDFLVRMGRTLNSYIYASNDDSNDKKDPSSHGDGLYDAIHHLLR